MTLHVSILGIDGSGKSTVAAALPAILAAAGDIVTGSASESFRVAASAEDLLAFSFYPDGLPPAARLAMKFKRAAKKFTAYPTVYPLFKLAQMLSQDCAAQALAERYAAAVFVSDGNTCLSTAGRAANYIRAASSGKQTIASVPEADDLRATFAYIFDDVPVPKESRLKLPSLGKGKLIYRLDKLLRLKAVWLPDVVVYLDLSPAVALTRIKSRGIRIDRHENLSDLTQAREMYLKTVAAFQGYRSAGVAHQLQVDDLTVGETISAVLEALRPHLISAGVLTPAQTLPLGTTQLRDGTIRRKALNHRYLFRYLFPKWFSGAWREPTFFLSKVGRLFLRQGYSASVMRAIYDKNEGQHGLFDRIFFQYPLHRAVYDRLQILVGKIRHELEVRLSSGQEVNVITGPSGFAYDIFQPLEDIAQHEPDAMKRVRIVATDLDPHGELENTLQERAQCLGIRLTFIRGDITKGHVRSQLEEAGPFDLGLFVGLSSWLPKPDMLAHLSSLRNNLLPNGRLITDCFTPDSYALSGRYIGYKANYYTPEVYRAILDYCGFDGLSADVESGRDSINHVFVAAPRVNWTLQDSRAPVAYALANQQSRDEAGYIQ